MKRFLKEMIGIMGLTILISSQSPAFAAENALSKVLTEQQILKIQTFSIPTEDQNKELADKVEEIIQYLDLDAKDDYSKIFAIYNYVCQNVEYDWAATDKLAEWDGGLGYGQLAYEALCEGKAVCGGIAKAVNLLMNQAGISSYYVEGLYYGIGHAWNLVELDGVYYFVDATSDLNKDIYEYFLKCEADFPNHKYASIEGVDDISSIKWAEKSWESVVQGDYERCGDFWFNIGSGDIIIHSYVGNDEDVIVPAEINGRKVKGIEQDAFLKNDTIKTLTISEGIERVSGFFAGYCSNLEKITLPASANICAVSGEMFFTGVDGFVDGCESLQEISVSKDNPYLVVKDGILYNQQMTDLIAYPAGLKRESVVIPEGIIKIRGSAFAYNPYIKKVVFPDSIRTIGYGAFNNCLSLEEINIPPYCQLIGQFAFQSTGIKHIKIPAELGDSIMLDCFMGTLLETIEVEEGNQYYHAENGALYAGTSLLVYAAGRKESEFVVPEGTTYIVSSAFMDAKNLKKVTIASTVETIARDAFYGCTQLEEIYLKEGKLKTIEKSAFVNCYKLTEIMLPEGIEEISKSLFTGCYQLTTVGIPASVKVIKVEAFDWTNLKNIYYAGSEEEWEKIDKGNNDFTDKKILFNGEICDHIWSDEFTVDKEPRCEDEGQKSIHCTLCGLMKKGTDEVIPAKGHEFDEWFTAIEACEEPAKRIRSCKNCGLQEEEVIGIFGHILTYYSGTADDVEIKFWHCSRCNKNFTDEQGTNQIEIADGWIEMSDGMHYLKNGEFLIDGWLTVDGHTYYLNEGVPLRNKGYAISNIDDSMIHYRFDENGYMLVNTWSSEGEDWYYYGSDGKAYSGIHEIDGSKYYFRADNRLYVGDNITIDGIFYACDSNGMLIQITGRTGWVEVKGKIYYVENGEFVKNSVVQIDDAYFGFNDMGQQYVDCEFEQDGNNYRAKQDGTLYVNEWCESSSSKYYYGEGGVAYTGIKEIEGATYYFSGTGKMQKSIEITENGTCYYFGADGKLEWKLDISSDGWKKENDGWYYVQDGQIMKSQWVTVDGYTYYLNENRRMLENEERLLQDPSGDESHVYRFAPNGAMVTGWYQLENGEWQYRDGNGIVKTGWVYLNNIWYYLNEEGIMATGWKIVNGAWYFFNESGVMQIGWLQLGTTWYYLDASGAMVTGWLNLNGTWYYMIPSGSMAIGWCAVGNNWYYLSESGAMVTGWLNLSGTWYYMNINGAMLTGTHVIDGNNYIFDQNGAWVE